MPEPNAIPLPAADAIEDELQQAIAICGGDPVAALRATLIANAFLEAEVERLSRQISIGFARGKVRRKVAADKAHGEN